MPKMTPRIVPGGWCLWVFYRVTTLFELSNWRFAGNAAWEIPLGGVLVPGIGCWLAWRSYLKPAKAVALWFRLVCLLLLWKFCLGNIVLRMQPSVLYKPSLFSAVADWLAFVTSSAILAIITFLSLALVVFSFLYWPGYCLKHGIQKVDPTAPPPLREGQATCAECGKVFSIADMIRHGSAFICAQCKPRFLQKLGEGARDNTIAKP